MNKVVTIKEMIETIKEKMNWSEAILAIELGVDSQNLLAWKRGRTPRSKNYKRLKEIYESLSEDDKEDELSLKFKQTENNILKALSDVDNNLLELQKKLNEERWSVAFTEANIKAWENKKKQLENKLKEIRREWGENNV
uniref:Helix-turn-helix protein n=1 Tax=Siphoviridae sp. ctAFE3 TaxID=2827796 RepID=A0A8S5S6Y8_9CAUD|nr:MAG TPA: helix-turn-helix protein [Siphoviridae sp. ctAFE3]